MNLYRFKKVDSKKIMDESTLGLFKKYLDPGDTDLVDPKEALKYGIYLEEKVEKSLFDKIIAMYGKDGELLNQTFHKSFKRVDEEDILSLVLEQISHYFSTYGVSDILDTTNDESLKDMMYIPREVLNIPDANFDKISLIKVTRFKDVQELEESVTSLVNSKIALSGRTINYILNLSEYILSPIEDIKNKEIKIGMYDLYNTVPKDPQEFLRFLILKITGNTLLIKDSNTKYLIRYSNVEEVLKLFKLYLSLFKNNEGYIKLSQIFNRYKKLFIEMKFISNDSYYNNPQKETARKELKKIINKISKLSKEYHIPFSVVDPLGNFKNYLNLLSNVTGSSDDETTLKSMLDKNPIWRVNKAALYLAYNNGDYKEKAYKIRNGKVFVKNENKDTSRFKNYEKFLRDYIIENLNEKVKDKTIYLPSNITYMLPQSEKQFVGNLPFSSVISFNHLHQSGIVFGIHWMDVDNQMTDLDLKVFSNTRSVSWNSSYKYGSDILYSGDLTMAPKPNGASEFIYISKNVIDENFTVKVNKYNSPKADIPFEFIIAYSDGNNIEDYIVDPKDIIIKIPCIIPKGQSEYVLGIYAPNIKMNKFIITDLSTNDLPVSKNNALDTILRQYLLNYEEATKDFTLNSLLEDSKAKISSTPEIEVAKEHWLIIGEDGGTKVEEASNLTELEPSRIIEKGLYKKVKVPVDIDLSIESLTKVTLLDLFTVN